jgi:hypothetical protein
MNPVLKYKVKSNLARAMACIFLFIRRSFDRRFDLFDLRLPVAKELSFRLRLRIL